jgi:hypothetical protein
VTREPTKKLWHVASPRDDGYDSKGEPHRHSDGQFVFCPEREYFGRVVGDVLGDADRGHTIYQRIAVTSNVWLAPDVRQASLI